MIFCIFAVHGELKEDDPLVSGVRSERSNWRRCNNFPSRSTGQGISWPASR